MPYLTFGEISLRLLLSMAAGVAIGYEREHHGRPAGLRTMLITCVSACVVMLLDPLLSRSAGLAPPADTGRFVQGVLTGIGFLGMGTIIREGMTVRGVTTAALLWLTTIVGLCFGAGQFALAFIACGVAFFALYVLPVLEHNMPRDWNALITITLQSDGASDDDIRRKLLATGVRLKNVAFEHNIAENRRTLHCDVVQRTSNAFDLAQRILHEMSECQALIAIHIADR